jgi:hypothetical protein
MNVFLIVVVALCIWGTVLWAMPTPRDRQLSRLRQAARLAGLTVKLMDEGLKRHIPALGKLEGERALYWLNFEFPFSVTDSGVCYATIKNNQICFQDRKMVSKEMIDFMADKNLEMAPLLPENNGLIFSNLGVAVVWAEIGEVDRVETISQFLQQLRISLMDN